VPDFGKWVNAGELEPGMWLQTSAGTWVQITAIDDAHRPQKVHNLTVDGQHTYFVQAGSAPVLVHNADLDELNACPTSRTTHWADVTVHDADGTLLHQYRIRSGAQTPAESAMGRGGETLSHTENRAARMAGGVPSYGGKVVHDDDFFLDAPVPEGGSVIITGTRPPCTSCRGAMTRAAEDVAATFVYMWEGAGRMNWWQVG
jgi:hypothetical protein